MDFQLGLARQTSDRPEKQIANRSPHTTKSSKTFQTTSPRGLPKVSSITRSRHALTDSTLDSGVLNLTVDDGSNGQLDDTVRSVRFTAALSNINALFASPSTLPKSTSVIQDDLSMSETEKINPNPAYIHQFTKPLLHKPSRSQSFHSQDNFETLRRKEIIDIKRRLDALETESITPPGTEDNSVERARKITSSPTSLLKFSRSSLPGSLKPSSIRTPETSSGSVRDSSEAPSSTSPVRRVIMSPIQVGKRLGGKIKGRQDVNGDSSSERRESHPSRSSLDDTPSRSATLKKGFVNFLYRFVD